MRKGWIVFTVVGWLLFMALATRVGYRRLPALFSTAGEFRPDLKDVDTRAAHADRMARGNIDAIFLGDSITQRWQLYDDLWHATVDADTTVNLGIAGDTIEHVLWRLEQGCLAESAPDFVFIQVGTNNVGRQTDEQVAAGIVEVAKSVHARLPKAEITVYGLFPWPGEEVRCKAINMLVKKEQRINLFFFDDISSAFVDDKGRAGKYSADGGPHLNRAGYTAWSDSIKKHFGR